jgi:hypothetical protein
MRKYLSLAVVALSSGGALVAAAGAASAATATDNWRAAPWQGSSPLAMHAAPFSHHDAGVTDAVCGMQKANYRVGQIDIKLEQKGCMGDLASMPSMPSVPGPPPVMGPPPMGSPEPCPVVCVPTPPPPPPVPCPPPVMKPPCPPTPPPPPPVPCPPVPCPPPVPSPPPVPCPPPTPNPCPPGEDHGWSGAEQHAAPEAGDAVAGLPILGSAVGGLL